MSLRLVFMGTPDFAVPTLAEIVGQGHRVITCYSRPPAAAGRGMEIKPSPVHRLAERFGIPVLTPKTLTTEEAATAFRAHEADVAVVVAYGMILPKAILDAPAFGCLNLHASLLPRWRGAAPIQRAVMAGDTETGVAVMKMEEGLDTGPVAMVERVVIGPNMTAGELHNRLAPLGADLIVRALAALSRGALSFTPQPAEGVTYARKISNEETRIDWIGPATSVHDQVRGLSPFPGAFFEADLGKGRERVKVLRTALTEASGEPGTMLDTNGTIGCGKGAVRLVQVQRAGKGPMAAEEFLRGVRLQPGARL
jgi:methionyl-tRNA formyltransferase